MLTRLIAAVALCSLLGFPAGIGAAWLLGDHEIAGGNAPPPYTPGDVNTAIVNSLGNAGRTEGFHSGTIGSTVKDILANDVLSEMYAASPTLAAEMDRNTVFPYMREVVVTLAEDPAATTGAVCARLGPASDGGGDTNTNPDGAPALSCTDSTDAGYTGGCQLTALGQSCTFMVRPKISGCTSYATCHVPIWVVGSASASSLSLHIAMIW